MWGILVVTAIVTGVLVAERESQLVRRGRKVSELEGRICFLKSVLNQEVPDLD